MNYETNIVTLVIISCISVLDDVESRSFTQLSFLKRLYTPALRRIYIVSLHVSVNSLSPTAHRPPPLLLPARRAFEPSSSIHRRPPPEEHPKQEQRQPPTPAPAIPTMRRPTLSLALGLGLGLSLVALFAARGAHASIHEYGGGDFAPRANSFFFHGGSEGLYASDHSSNSSASFIRYAPATASARPSLPRLGSPFPAPLGFCGPRTHRGGAGGQDQMRLLNAAHFVDPG
jgi:hypothetical protein